MGKGQSKHGQCYLVNAHFNPLCQLEDTNSLQSADTPLTSQDSGLQLTPEISFTLSEEDGKPSSDKNVPAECALQVFLPKEGVSALLKNAAMGKTSEPGAETSTDSQQKVTLEYVQNNSQTEKQEFSFVLRNYTGAERNDVEKIVLSSIYEALQSSLKLPSSGTHTLKVHLTLSPDPDNQNFPSSSVGVNTHEQCAKSVSNPTASDNPCQPHASESAPDKEPTTPQKPISVAKCCQQEKLKSPMHSLKHEASPSPRSRRQKIYSERKEARKWVDAAQFARRDFVSPNFKNTPRHSIARESQQQGHKELHSNHGDCSHYLDLARLKISDPNHGVHQGDQSCDPRWLNPAYCSPRHIERGHKSCHLRRYANLDFSNPTTPQKHAAELQHKQRETELHSGVLKQKLLQKAKSNLLDLSFDLEDKQSVDQTAQPQHRRSRSYDTNEYSLVNSPKLLHRTCRCPKCTSSVHYDEIVQLSPSRRHRHCHRKREKEKLRAMEQVARWLEREDINCKQQTQNLSQNSETYSRDTVVERHEYHHVHEHHHYYHYVES